MKNLIIILLSASCLFSCSASWHMRKAVWKDPSIIAVDTISIRDTIRTYTERIRKDSVFIVSSDTTIIQKENLRITHYIHNDSVYITGECDTVFIEVPYEIEVPVEKVIYPKKEKINLLQILKSVLISLFILVCLIAIAFLLRAIKRKHKSYKDDKKRSGE